MAFELPALTYDHAALAARGMSQETLELHHDKHHQAYVTNLNGLIEGTCTRIGRLRADGSHAVAEVEQLDAAIVIRPKMGRASAQDGEPWGGLLGFRPRW